MRVTARGVEGVIAELDALAERAADLGPVLEVAAEETTKIISDSFRNLRSPDGQPWAPLDESTIKKRRKRRGAKRTRVIRPLVDSGVMRGTTVVTHTRTALEMKSRMPYSVYHQFGNGRMYRPFMPIEKSGSSYVLMTGGRAGRHWREVRDMVIEYIRTGRITE